MCVAAILSFFLFVHFLQNKWQVVHLDYVPEYI